MRKTTLLVCCVALLVLVPATPSHAVVAAAVPGSTSVGYATSTVVTAPGGPLIFTNADIYPHNLVAFKVYLPPKETKDHEWCSLFPKKACPLFWSETIATGSATPVEGLEGVESGKEYAFFCTLHPGMKGTLKVP